MAGLPASGGAEVYLPSAAPEATRGKGGGGKDGEYSGEGKLVVAQALRGDFIVRCAHQGMGVNTLKRLRPALGFFVGKELSYVREVQFQHGYGYVVLYH